MKGQKIDKKVRQKLTRVKRCWPEQLQRYAEDERKLGGRNSYSKTDPDATFMRMKEDHMKNGQLKPGYNVQISTNNQMILNYTLHQTTTDTTTLVEHLEEYRNQYNQNPRSITADAGYGSEENYRYTEEHDIEAFIKYNNFHKEQSKKWRLDIHRWENLHYNAEQDCYYCPMGQPMRNIGEYRIKTKTGYEQTITRYQAINCRGCPLRGACHKSQGNRIMEINKNAKRLKEVAKNKLNSDDGLTKRRRRSIEPESVFGNIKHNKGFKRFMLRGMEKVGIEFGLIAISHNLRKMCA